MLSFGITSEDLDQREWTRLRVTRAFFQMANEQLHLQTAVVQARVPRVRRQVDFLLRLLRSAALGGV